MGASPTLGFNDAGTVYGLAIFGPVVFFFFLLGWFGWWTHTRKKRAWLDGSIDPESRPQRLREDAEAVAYLAFVLAIGLAITILLVILWPKTATQPHSR